MAIFFFERGASEPRHQSTHQVTLDKVSSAAALLPIRGKERGQDVLIWKS